MDRPTRFLLRPIAVRYDHLPIRLANGGALVGTCDSYRSEPIHEAADRLQNVIQDFGTGHRNPHVVFARLRIAVDEAETFGATIPRRTGRCYQLLEQRHAGLHNSSPAAH